MEAEEDLIQCILWYVVKKDVLKANWCNVLVCKKWSDEHLEKQSICPHCREANFNPKPDIFINKLLEVITKTCPSCKEKIKILEFSKHQEECNKEITCKVCNDKFFKKDLWEHLKGSHQNYIEGIFIKGRQPATNQKMGETIRLAKQEEEEEKEERKPEDFKDEEINSDGNKAIRNIKNQKYYWGKKIEYKFEENQKEFPKVCKPSERGALNCPSWMQLDLQSKNLICLSLVNARGNTSNFEITKSEFSWGWEIMGSKNNSSDNSPSKMNTWSDGRNKWMDCKKLTKLYNLVDLGKFPYFSLIFPEKYMKDIDIGSLN